MILNLHYKAIITFDRKSERYLWWQTLDICSDSNKSEGVSDSVCAGYPTTTYNVLSFAGTDNAGSIDQNGCFREPQTISANLFPERSVCSHCSNVMTEIFSNQKWKYVIFYQLALFFSSNMADSRKMSVICFGGVRADRIIWILSVIYNDYLLWYCL